VGASAHARADTSPRDPQRGPLHALLREHLETFLAERAEAGAPLPGFVLEELRGYLRCGVLAAGCARYECEGCGAVRVTALSCKGRGFCPRCGGRRMAERARHLAERVFPEDARVRQWVLSLPFDLRWRAAFDHALARRLAGLLQAAIARRYRRLAREAGLTDPQGGAVLVMQRFSSDLRTNLHFHLVSLDGAYGTDAHGQRRFETAPAPSPDDVEAILRDFLHRARALLDAGDDAPPDDEDQLALAHTLAAASRRHGAQPHAPDDAPESSDGQVHLPTRRKARLDGFDLDAEVCVKAHDRPRLEALCRYVLRPPLALDRLKILGQDLVAIELKRPWSNGTTHVSMSVRTFFTRLAALVPRPRANTTLYYGVLASHAKHRRAVVPEPPDRPRAHDASWAALMRHSFGLDVLSCRLCRGRMRFTHVLFDPAEVRRLLAHLHCFSDPLPVSPSRGPPDWPDTLDFP
jgi:hypothetical protein